MWPFDRANPVRLDLEAPAVKSVAVESSVSGLEVATNQVKWKSADPSRLMREGFQVNATVYGCVMGWARAVSTLNWYLVRKPKAGAKGVRLRKTFAATTAGAMVGTELGRKALEGAEVDDHPVLRLKERPNPTQKGCEYDEAMVAYLLTTGNVYQELIAGRDERVLQLWLPRPDRMRVVPHPTLKVGGYVLVTDNGREIPFSTAEIDHLRLFGGLDEFYGLAPLVVAARSVDSDNEAMRWSYGLLQNDMRPSGAFVSKIPLADPAYQRLRKQIREREGAKGAGRAMVLDNGLEWVTFTLSPSEVGWLESRKSWFEDICTAYNYGKELLGRGQEATFANRREALKAHYTENVIPLAMRLRDIWNTRIVPAYGGDLFLDFDRDQIEALQEDRDKLWTRVEASRVLTVNEKREALGYPALGDEGEVVLVSSSDVPLELVGEGGVERQPTSPVVDVAEPDDATDPMDAEGKAALAVKAIAAAYARLAE